MAQEEDVPETYRPRRPGRKDDDVTDKFDKFAEMRRKAENKDEDETEAPAAPSGAGGFAIKGMENAPPDFLRVMRAAKGESAEPKKGLGSLGGGKSAEPKQDRNLDRGLATGSGQLKELLEGLKGSTTLYHEVELPSKGRFYDGTNGPADGILSIRPMTGEEEQILATPNFVRKGQAINMIFAKCLKEDYKPQNLLTIDRTYLLIYLRGISYTPQYDVDVKCPECEKKFATSIGLDLLDVESCPDDYGADGVLEGVLPNSGYHFNYRLSCGRDEQQIQDYRDRRIKMFGDASADDTLTHRTAQLIENIEGLTDKEELKTLIRKLPINDVAYMRGCINEPPFGVDTDVEIMCPGCLQEFTVDLPLEANFFFPRRKKDKTQA